MSTAATEAARSPRSPRAALPAWGRPIQFGFIPSLDGLRALAVLGVMLYHGGAPILGGGFLTIDVFFVLSGFLITSLLVGEWRKRLTIHLGQFWTRRARRLLPALLVMLIGVALYAKFLATPGEFSNLRLDSLSSLFYVANWHFIFAGTNYFNLTAQPSPLRAHVVAVDRGAVLHRVASGGAAHAAPRGQAPPRAPALAPVRHGPGRLGGLGRRHAPALPRPPVGDAHLRGHRHPLPGPAGRGHAGRGHGHLGAAPPEPAVAGCRYRSRYAESGPSVARNGGCLGCHRCVGRWGNGGTAAPAGDPAHAGEPASSPSRPGRSPPTGSDWPSRCWAGPPSPRTPTCGRT